MDPKKSSISKLGQLYDNSCPRSSFTTTLSIMFRLTRPLLQQVLKGTTGITGLAVHPNPLPELSKTYQSTLTLLASIPSTSVYRQGVEAITERKLKIVQEANGDVSEVEKQLDEGQIEESLDIANDELKLVSNMIEWKSYVFSFHN
jgi:NADH dehydrogenase (ubiquinone) 1 alpha subcomplex subunit 5